MKLNITIPERFRIGLLPAILLVLAGNAFVIAMIRFADADGSAKPASPRTFVMNETYFSRMPAVRSSSRK